MKNHIFALGLFLSLVGCQKEELSSPSPPEFALSGGQTTIFDATSNAFSTPAANLSAKNLEKHLDGDLHFEQTFVTAPAPNNAGLGPLFNNNSCISCHIRDGRSQPTNDGDGLSGFLLRISIPGNDAFGGPKAVPGYGTQLQNRAIFGQNKEASFTKTEVEMEVPFADGTTRSLNQPKYILKDAYHILPADLMISPRVAPALIGLGLLEAIPESDILSRSDINDSDGNGISGKPNWVWDVERKAATLGRFGWKAEQPSVLQQSAGAYNQDMGVTTRLFPEENGLGQIQNVNDDGVIDLPDEILEAVAFYTRTLAVPAMRNYNSPHVLKGREIFTQLKCNECHVPQQKTGAALIPELSDQTIFPYTDLLLHDMGEDLADHRPSFMAGPREWRTPPLWGMGLLPVVNGHMRLLHDGRARNIEEAILWHGGEAEFSRDTYLTLTEKDRNLLLAFLESI